MQFGTETRKANIYLPYKHLLLEAKKDCYPDNINITDNY